MSEHQYYEFRAVDRPLTPAQIRKLRSISTRAHISAVAFRNHYEWGDFKGDPELLMESYFDAFVYLANWGFRQFSMRLPAEWLRESVTSKYLAGDGIRLRRKNDFLILDFSADEEEMDWEEKHEEYDDDDDESGWMASLLGVRTELAQGDIRALYLGWLLCVQSGVVDEDVLEPPVPSGLGNLSASLDGFANFLRIDRDLIAAAAKASDEAANAPHDEEVDEWVRSLAPKDKSSFLRGVVLGEIADPRSTLLRQFHGDRKTSRPSRRPGRTAKELLAEARSRAEQRRRRREQRAAKLRARREREQAAAREAHLHKIGQRMDQVWREVDALIATKRPRDYDRAAQLLTDLRDASTRTDSIDKFRSRLARLRRRQHRKPSLMGRLERAGLI